MASNTPKSIKMFTCRTCANWLTKSRDFTLDRRSLICEDTGTCFYFPGRRVEDTFSCKNWKQWDKILTMAKR